MNSTKEIRTLTKLNKSLLYKKKSLRNELIKLRSMLKGVERYLETLFEARRMHKKEFIELKDKYESLLLKFKRKKHKK